RLGLEVVNELLKNKDNLKEGRYVGTLIVKELCMRRLEGAEKSRKYLYELLDSDILNQFPSFSHYVYHSLGWNYLESQKYEKALEALQKALPLRPKQLDKAITTLLIGRIYFEIGQYEEAQKYYSETKETILLSESLRTKRLWIDEQLDLYCKLNQIHQVKELFIELKSLVDIDKFPESMLYELKTSMYKRFEGLSPLRREEYLFLYNFFTS
ncbi:MAG: tetratricopeptide repeat protein, partial [Turicibacter sp.]|nr:tetratricopeptide repeat protein [Turicibacter sp.]